MERRKILPRDAHAKKIPGGKPDVQDRDFRSIHSGGFFARHRLAQNDMKFNGYAIACLDAPPGRLYEPVVGHLNSEP
ncbi:MAG: hypothetical protein GTO18_21430 [Anaerolineales bacterium]|nr:hypothetical protein [Anaerolineales bacterium]